MTQDNSTLLIPKDVNIRIASSRGHDALDWIAREGGLAHLGDRAEEDIRVVLRDRLKNGQKYVWFTITNTSLTDNQKMVFKLTFAT